MTCYISEHENGVKHAIVTQYIAYNGCFMLNVLKLKTKM